jgi:hypothetical protein
LCLSVTITKPLFIAEYAAYLQKPMDTTHYYLNSSLWSQELVRTGKKPLRIADQR